MRHTQFNVLLVDDEQDVVKLYSKLLKDEKIKAFHFQDPIEAFRFLSEVKFPIDLIISDLNMPKITGLEFLSEIKNMSKCLSIPFIFLTGIDDDPSKLQAFDNGAVAYIQKPVDNQVFIAQVKSIINSYAINSFKDNIRHIGSSKDWELDEIINFCEKVKINGFSHIYDKNKSGVIFFERGVLEDIKLNNLSGADALDKMSHWKEYRFLIASGRYIPEIIKEFIEKTKLEGYDF